MEKIWSNFLAFLENINFIFDFAIFLGEEDKANLLGDELAAKLSEPKTQLMIGIVEIVGVDVALDLFNKTKDIESKGGMMIKNGERRRTPGGVFMQLLRDAGTYIFVAKQNQISSSCM